MLVGSICLTTFLGYGLYRERGWWSRHRRFAKDRPEPNMDSFIQVDHPKNPEM